MEKYNALIVEDVEDTSQYILSRIKTLCPVIKHIDQAFNLAEAKSLISENNYDIVFLDIQMPTGTSFDLLKQLSEEENINFEIIFITGESAKEYTLQAIKFSAIDFLYKPLDDTELVIAVNRATEKLKHERYNRQIKLLLNIIDEQATIKHNKIAFHLRDGIIEFVDIEELKYIEADGVVSNVYLESKKKLSVNRNLGYYKELLIEDYNFIPISNSVLINKNYIKRYNHKTQEMILKDDVKLHVSRRRGKELQDLLNTKKGGFSFSSVFKFFKK